MREVGRKRPAKGVRISSDGPTIIFLTICTRNRSPWLASNESHDLILNAWSAGSHWLVGRYVLMPDHIHLFCSPHGSQSTLEQWVRFWKSHVSHHAPCQTWRWQENFWDTRLRRGESYTEKWNYVRYNPVRAGLATTPDDWPYQGVINHLPW